MIYACTFWQKCGDFNNESIVAILMSISNLVSSQFQQATLSYAGVRYFNHRQPKLVYCGMMGAASSIKILALILKDTITARVHNMHKS